MFSRRIHCASMLPQCFPVLPYRNWTHFKKNPHMQAVAKFFRAWASEHSCLWGVQAKDKFWIKLNGTIGYPYVFLIHTNCDPKDGCSDIWACKLAPWWSFSKKCGTHFVQHLSGLRPSSCKYWNSFIVKINKIVRL